jgi:hypothetical protein
MAILVEIDWPVCRKPNLTNTDSVQALQSVFECDARRLDLRRRYRSSLKPLNIFGAKGSFPLNYFEDRKALS